MKKVIVIIAIFFAANFMSAQNMFDKLEDLDDVSAFVLTKDAFELLKKFPNANSENMETFNLIKGLQEFKIFSTEETKAALKMENMVGKAIKSASLTQLMRVKDKGTKAKIYVKSTDNKDIVSEVLMFINNSTSTAIPPKTTVISLLGNIDVNKLAELANKYQSKTE